LHESRDPWGRTQSFEAEQLDPMVARLEQRGREAWFGSMLSDFFDALGIDGQTSVLDLGSGTGVAARRIARRPGFRGHVTGVDLSADFIAVARRLAAEESLDDRLTFATGDTTRLAYADGAFDAVVAVTLLSHVDDPLAILREARRLVCADGVVGVFDVDWASLTHDSAREPVAAIIDHKPVGMFFAQPRVLRQMPVLAPASGFRIAGSRSYVFSEAGHADYAMNGIKSLAAQLAGTGYVSEAKAAAWLAALTRAHEAGEYFGSCNYHAYVLRP
jgi:SAM-dependent methyltransferase